MFGKQPKQPKQQGKAAAVKPSKSPTLTITVETVKDERCALTQADLRALLLLTSALVLFALYCSLSTMRTNE